MGRIAFSVMLLVILATSATAETMACFGNSITADGPANVSFCPRVGLPTNWHVEIYGKPAAPCRFVYNRPGPETCFLEGIRNYGTGDVVVVECRNTEPSGTEGYDLDFDAVLQMDQRCHAVGAMCVFFEQPAYLYDDSSKPWTAEFYAAVEPLLDSNTIIVQNGLLWPEKGWNLDPGNYQPDQVHMSETGALLLAGTLEDALGLPEPTAVVMALVALTTLAVLSSSRRRRGQLPADLYPCLELSLRAATRVPTPTPTVPPTPQNTKPPEPNGSEGLDW
jgi:hypothetical protein